MLKAFYWKMNPHFVITEVENLYPTQINKKNKLVFVFKYRNRTNNNKKIHIEIINQEK